MGFVDVSTEMSAALGVVSLAGGGWRSLGPIWPYVLGGSLVVGALTGVFMWLAFYSANHGYDDGYDRDGP